MTRDELLAHMGLQRRAGAAEYVLPALGVFGAGLLVGAGLGLLFAPKPGNELRHALGETAENYMSRIRRRRGSNGDLDSMSRDELYQRAQELGIEGRSEMTKDELVAAISGAH